MHITQGSARIVQTARSGADTVHMVLEAPWLQQALPGQFIMLRIYAGTAPLLRRPISLCAVTPSGIELLIKIRGSGTERMAGWPVGHAVDIIGPLGNGFAPPPPGTPAVLVAGGIGIAPLICLARWLKDNRPDCSVRILFGARTAADCDALVPFIPASCALQIATEDGSRGTQGSVTDLLAYKPAVCPDALFYGCGPMPMLKSLARLACDTSHACFISLEAHMACGVGACLGCTVPAYTPQGPSQVRVCADGPVFEARRIFPAP
ncbi:MAG: dihydroorotate dehydrogenase electron transfer subunit [Deltaproteobacteria bacterium]|nr:dihydroorotate dehydrogenase electron transfer subunit [Deltaproteobacteria bacterium]